MFANNRTQREKRFLRLIANAGFSEQTLSPYGNAFKSCLGSGKWNNWRFEIRSGLKGDENNFFGKEKEMKKLFLLIIAILIICGCVRRYSHFYKGPEDFIIDKHDCEVKAEERIARQGYGGQLLFMHYVDECLRLEHIWIPTDKRQSFPF